MVAAAQPSHATAQGVVALYARDARWRRAVSAELTSDGHSSDVASSPEGLQELLRARRFDVLVMKVRSEAEGRELATVLEDARLPLHTIQVGSAAGLTSELRQRRGGTFRFVPGPLAADEVARLVDLSISVGGWAEAHPENGEEPRLEEIDLREIFEAAAATVFRAAKRKQLRFSVALEGPATTAMGDAELLRQVAETILGLAVSSAPRHANVSVDGEAGSEDWIIRFRVTNGKSVKKEPRQVVQAVREEASALTTVARLLKRQRGMFWVDLVGPETLAFSLTLPLPEELGAGATA